VITGVWAVVDRPDKAAGSCQALITFVLLCGRATGSTRSSLTRVLVVRGFLSVARAAGACEPAGAGPGTTTPRKGATGQPLSTVVENSMYHTLVEIHKDRRAASD
jgi:hypothetical protein